MSINTVAAWAQRANDKMLETVWAAAAGRGSWSYPDIDKRATQAEIAAFSAEESTAGIDGPSFDVARRLAGEAEHAAQAAREIARAFVRKVCP